MNKTKTDKDKIRTTTKLIVWTVITCAIIWITWSYILSTISLVMYGNSEPLSDLSQQVCITIIGAVVSYAIKSYLENRSKANNELEYYKLNNGHSDESSSEDDLTFEDIN